MNEASNNKTLRNLMIVSVYLLVSFTLTGAAIAANYFAMRNLLTAIESVGWPRAHGVVTISSVEALRSSDPDNDYSYTYHPKISYFFELNGKRFAGDKIDFVAFGSSDQSYADSMVSGYPVGAAVDVYYKPEDPSINVLYPGVDRGAWIGYAVMLAFSSIGFIMLFKARQFIGEIQAMIR